MPSVGARVSSPVLIGRVSQTDGLHAAFTRAAGGEARAVLLGGEAGVGKSRMLAEFVGWVVQQGGRALVGGCLELAGGDLPYAPIIEALRPVARIDQPVVVELGSRVREIARILPELEPLVGAPDTGLAPTVESQARPFEAILGLLKRLAGKQPLVLAIEDAQWSDRSTRDFVAFLVQNLRDERVLFVGTFRTDLPDPDRTFERFLGQLEHTGRADRIGLQPLTRDELSDLVRAIQGTAPDARLIDDIYRRTEGNPFFAEELLAAHSATPGSRLSTSLSDLLLARVVGLSRLARKASQVVAIAGRRQVSDLLIGQATEMLEEDLFGALREAVESGILEVTEDDTYRFRHVLLGEAMAGEMLPGERRRLHARIAASLESASISAEITRAMLLAELAWHWDQAGEAATALPASIAAGYEAARMSAFAESAKHYGRALRLWPLVADPVRVARVTLREPDLPPVRLEDRATELGLLADARDDLVHAQTRCWARSFATSK
jgi:predicted ATPase